MRLRPNTDGADALEAAALKGAIAKQTIGRAFEEGDSAEFIAGVLSAAESAARPLKADAESIAAPAPKDEKPKQSARRSRYNYVP